MVEMVVGDMALGPGIYDGARLECCYRFGVDGQSKQNVTGWPGDQSPARC